MAALTFPFVFVGCWNQPAAKADTNAATKAADAATPRNAVAAAVTALAEVNHVVLGGDNVYPRPKPGEKNKEHEAAVFDTGLALYRANGKEVVGAFGNHNTDMISYQKAAFGIAGPTYYERLFADGKTHLVVLDTNIMTNADAMPAMLAWFRETVAGLPADHSYIVVQHEPYFVARQKKFLELANADPFLNVMFMRPPKAILCADTHNYQRGIIRQVFEDGSLNSDVPPLLQIIVGTGGANPDPFNKEFTQRVIPGRYMFQQLETKPGYGYLYVNKMGDGRIEFEFRKVMDWSGVGGYRKTHRQTHKRKAKSRRTRRHK
jgi:hypothetical protein